MFKLILFLTLVVVNIVSFICLCFQGIEWIICVLKHKDCCHIVTALQKKGIVFGCVLCFLLLFVIVTQLLAFTPQIEDSNGKKVEGSIADLTKVTLNDHKEWISIRGVNKDAPILLFLAGGPGGTQMAAVRYELEELEKHFVVVNWDQPGSGKSYHCMNRKVGLSESNGYRERKR